MKSCTFSLYVFRRNTPKKDWTGSCCEKKIGTDLGNMWSTRSASRADVDFYLCTSLPFPDSFCSSCWCGCGSWSRLFFLGSLLGCLMPETTL